MDNIAATASEETSTSGEGDQPKVGQDDDGGKCNQKEEGTTTNHSIILVTGLSDDVSGRDLKKFLRQFGKIGKIKLMMIKTSVTSTGKMVNRRFAHVTVPSVVSAEQLVEKISQVDRNLKGSCLEVTRAPESGPMSANYTDSSSVPNPDKNGDGDDGDGEKPVEEPADPSCSNGRLNDENDRGLLYSDQSSHNTPSPTPTPTRTIGSITRKEIQLVSEGEITDEGTTDGVVSSSNQSQQVRSKDHCQRPSNPPPPKPGTGKGKGDCPKESCNRNRPKKERTSSSVSSVISRRRRGESKSSVMESPRQDRRKRRREESRSRSPPKRAGSGRDSMDRGRRGRSVAVTGKERRVRRSPSQLAREGILTYEQIKEMQRQRDRMRQKGDIDWKCGKGQDRRNSSGTSGKKRCSSKESRAARELQQLERAQQKLQEEREKVEMEKLELIQMQREQQRKEMEEIEREKNRVRRAKEKLLKEQVWKSKTNRFGKTIAEQVIEDLREKERLHEELLMSPLSSSPFQDRRSRSKSIPPRPRPSSLSRTTTTRRSRSPERKKGRYSFDKPNFNWEDDDDDDGNSPPRNMKTSGRSGVYSSVRSPREQILFKGDGSLQSSSNRLRLVPASQSSSSNSLGYSSSQSGRKDLGSGKDAVDEFLGKIGARAMTHGSQWKFGGGSGTGTSLSETVSGGIRPSAQTDTFIDLLGNPYTITSLSERGTGGGGGGGFPRAGRLSDAIASLSQNGTSTNVNANGNQRNRIGGGGGGDGGGYFSHANRYKSEFQRYFSGS